MPRKEVTPISVEQPREDREQDDVGGGESADSNGFASPPSESINVWPDEAAEVAFFGATSEPETPSAKPMPESGEQRESPAPPLPKLEELVNRIPPESRELLDELFRAKFTVVRRIKSSDLKSN